MYLEFRKQLLNAGGVVYYNGDAAVTARGVCWNLEGNPTTNDAKTWDGDGEGNFVSAISSLKAGTTYRLRAYASSELGTSYGEEMTFRCTGTGEGVMVDIDGNQYKTIKIGNQEWMAENLKVTHYADGTAIPYVNWDFSWSDPSLEDGYCYVDGSSSYKEMFGNLYNWRVLNDPSGIAPPGWRVPNNNDWTKLINYLGGEEVAGSKMKTMGTEYWIDNFDATNESGFSARAGGQREPFSGEYLDLYFKSFFWSSSSGSGVAYGYSFEYDNSTAYQSAFSPRCGLSVRLIKN